MQFIQYYRNRYHLYPPRLRGDFIVYQTYSENTIFVVQLEQQLKIVEA